MGAPGTENIYDSCLQNRESVYILLGLKKPWHRSLRWPVEVISYSVIQAGYYSG